MGDGGHLITDNKGGRGKPKHPLKSEGIRVLDLGSGHIKRPPKALESGAKGLKAFPVPKASLSASQPPLGEQIRAPVIKAETRTGALGPTSQTSAVIPALPTCSHLPNPAEQTQLGKIVLQEPKETGRIRM